MNVVDRSILLGVVAHVVGRWPRFDLFVATWNSEEIGLKSDLAMAVVWWAWFRPGAREREQRSAIVSTIFATAVAVVLGRTLSHFLAFRARPFADPSLRTLLPWAEPRALLRQWSSFPSDHAMVWAALATGIGTVSVGAGVLLWVVGVLAVCLPRIYVGQHYPTDILAGIAIGTVVGWLMTRPRISSALSRPFLRWEAKRPAWFYALAFLLTLHVADMFTVLRKFASTMLHG